MDWDEQFFNRAGKTVREDRYTPELLASGKCDVYASGMTRLPWREKTAATIKDTSYQTWLQGQNESACAANPIRIRLMTFEETSRAVDTGDVDFKVENIEETMWLASPFKNSVAAFAVGPVHEQAWAFRKEDKDLQAASKSFLEAQKAQRDSLMNRQWKNFLGMTLPEYIEQIPK